MDTLDHQRGLSPLYHRKMDEEDPLSDSVPFRFSLHPCMLIRPFQQRRYPVLPVHHPAAELPRLITFLRSAYRPDFLHKFRICPIIEEDQPGCCGLALMVNVDADFHLPGSTFFWDITLSWQSPNPSDFPGFRVNDEDPLHFVRQDQKLVGFIERKRPDEDVLHVRLQIRVTYFVR